MGATDNRLLATQYYECWVVDLYHRERNHQGLGNALIEDCTHRPTGTRIRRRPRLGGLLNYYERAA